MQEFDLVQFIHGSKSQYLVNHDTCVVLEVSDGQLWRSGVSAFEIRNYIEYGRAEVIGKSMMEFNIRPVGVVREDDL